MAQRSYNGRELVANPLMAGTGSTTSENAWVGDAAYLWRVAQTSSGNNILTEFTTFENRQCLKMQVDGIVRAGAAIGQIYIGNLAEYAGPTINAANLATYGIKIRPNYTYNVSVTYKIASMTADTGSISFFAGGTFYNTNGTRNTTTPANAFSDTAAGDWKTSTGTLTRSQSGMSHIGIRIGFLASADPTVNGNAVVYISNISLKEVLPARTTATSRTVASNRVATRDFGTALRFDGSTSEVAIDGISTAFGNTIPSEFTFAARVKTTSLAQGTVISLGRTNSASPFLLIDVGLSGKGRPRIVYRLDDGVTQDSAQAIDTAYNVADGRFHLLMGIKTATTLSLYVDNVLAAQDSALQTGAVTFNCANIGVLERTTKSSYFAGIIEEPRIWTRALTSTERTNYALYHAVPLSGLVGEYLFNEASGTTAIDTSGNGNNGTITGATYATDTPKRARTAV